MSELPIQFVQANGLRHAYLEEGEGPLVLMFHGFPDTPDTWDHLRPAVAAAGYRVVTPYLRGYAPSEIPKRDTDGRTQAEDVLALIDALGEERAIIIGHDWGASAVYGACALGPEKVEKLVAVGIPHPLAIVPTPRILWGVRHFLVHRLPGAVERFARDDYAEIEVLFRRWSPTWSFGPEDVEPVREAFRQPGCLDAALGYYRAIPLAPPKWLNAVLPMPTMVFAGLDDPIVTPKAYDRAAKMFSGSYEVVRVPGGHFMHRESKQAVADAVLRFLAS